MTRPIHLRSALFILAVFGVATLFVERTQADIFKKKEKLALAFLAGMVFGQQGRHGGYPIPVPWPMQQGQQVLPLPLPIPIGGGGGYAMPAPAPPKKVFHNLVKHHHHFGKVKLPETPYGSEWSPSGDWSKNRIASASTPSKVIDSSSAALFAGKPFSSKGLAFGGPKKFGSGSSVNFDTTLPSSGGFDKFAHETFSGQPNFGDKFAFAGWDGELQSSGSSIVDSFHIGAPMGAGGGFRKFDGFNFPLHGYSGFENQPSYPRSAGRPVHSDSQRSRNRELVAALKELLAKTEADLLKGHSGEFDFRPSTSHSPVFSKSVSSSSSSMSSSSGSSRQKPHAVKT